MIQPLAMVFYENLLPGTQLVNRLQDLGYRVSTVNDPPALLRQAQQDKPMIILADLASRQTDICSAISELKNNPETGHIPIIAFSSQQRQNLQTAARAAGADLVATDNAVLTHLAQLLGQALEIE